MTWCCAACPAEDAGGGGGEDADGAAPDGLAAGVRFCALEGREEGLLWDLAPAFVVNYDPDIAFVRQLEARGPPRTLRLRSVHMLLNSGCSCVLAVSGRHAPRPIALRGSPGWRGLAPAAQTAG
jgi:hypothetical protein